MAEEKTEEEGGGAAKPAGPKLSPQLILALANTIMVLGAIGALVYTKILYQRPQIVEEEEFQKKKEEAKEPVPVTDRPLVTFDQLTVNIAMTSGKAHYVTIIFALECKDEAIASYIKSRQPVFIDKFGIALAKKQLTELNTIQGKLFLKTDLIRQFNEMLANDLNKPGAITDIFFPTFILQ